MPPNATVIETNSSDKLTALAAAYGLIDGFNAASSTLRLAFDVMYQNNSRLSIIAMREWMSTQQGMEVVITETLFLMGISCLTNQFPLEPNDESIFKRYIADVWNFLRPMLKGFKNAYKGIRSLVQASDIITGQNSTYLIIPLWVVVGLLSGLNRNWYSGITKTRKKILKSNEAMLKQLQEPGCTSTPNGMFEKDYDCMHGFLSKTFGGIIDGLYLYMGSAVVVTFTPAIFTVVMLFSTIFTLTCIATRIYEEYSHQRKVLVSIDMIELEKKRNTLKTVYASLCYKSTQLKETIDGNVREQLEAEFYVLLNVFEIAKDNFLNSKARVRTRLTRSDFEAILEGFSEGLAIYGAISALMFSMYTVAAMLTYSFPPFLVLLCVTFGMGCLIGFGTYAYFKNIAEVEELQKIDDEQNRELTEIYGQLTNAKQIVDNQQIELNLIQKSSVLNPILFKAEVLRSGFSGIGKSPKAIEFIFFSLQEADEKGHNQDTPVMFMLTALCTILYTSVLGLSAYYDIFDAKNRKTTPSSERSWCGFFSDTFSADASLFSFFPFGPNK